MVSVKENSDENLPPKYQANESEEGSVVEESKKRGGCLSCLHENLFMICILAGVLVGFALGFGLKAANPSQDAIVWIGVLLVSIAFGIAARKAGDQGRAFLELFKSVTEVVLKLVRACLLSYLWLNSPEPSPVVDFEQKLGYVVSGEPHLPLNIPLFHHDHRKMLRVPGIRLVFPSLQLRMLGCKCEKEQTGA
ncbi:unnamed protein product [Schistocephalus solidus]|uniref:Transmembrane protein n=1 Tax=Schistocephalus solidus TaxID=70667 RepID=A0A183TCS4_SCHSO|nr:unnamed protein product [Schistocephalus solidus]